MWFLVIIPAAALFVVLSPVLLPLAAVSQARDERRMRGAAEASACARCGRILGKPALDLADEVVAAERKARPPGEAYKMRRIVRRLFAVCTACGARHGWDEEGRVFPLLDDGEPST